MTSKACSRVEIGFKIEVINRFRFGLGLVLAGMDRLKVGVLDVC